MTPESRLDAGADSLSLSLSDTARQRLLDYVALLLRWNRVTNLTAVRDPVAMVERHLLDCLAVLPCVAGPRVLDLGSGGGLPGLVFAIVRPEWALWLVDSNGKKTRFLTQAAIELGLSNVTVVNARAESWQNGRDFDTVVSRAFTELGGFAAMARAFVREEGRIVAMTGKQTGHTVGDSVCACEVTAIEAVDVPFVEAERHVVSLKPIETETP